MPVYAWKGLAAGGKSVAGTRESDGPKALRQTLRKENVFISEVREVVGGKQSRQALGSGGTGVKGLRREVDIKGFFERVKPRDVLIVSGDHAYRMNYGPLIDFHRRSRSDLTMVFRRTDCGRPSRYGVGVLGVSGRTTGVTSIGVQSAGLAGSPGATSTRRLERQPVSAISRAQPPTVKGNSNFRNG